MRCKKKACFLLFIAAYVCMCVILNTHTQLSIWASGRFLSRATTSCPKRQLGGPTYFMRKMKVGIYHKTIVVFENKTDFVNVTDDVILRRCSSSDSGNTMLLCGLVDGNNGNLRHTHGIGFVWYTLLANFLGAGDLVAQASILPLGGQYRRVSAWAPDICQAVPFPTLGPWAQKKCLETKDRGPYFTMGETIRDIFPDASFPGVPEAPLDPNCIHWGCTCQGFSDTFGTSNSKRNYGEAKGFSKAWWIEYGCASNPTSKAKRPTVAFVDHEYQKVWGVSKNEWSARHKVALVKIAIVDFLCQTHDRFNQKFEGKGGIQTQNLHFNPVTNNLFVLDNPCSIRSPNFFLDKKNNVNFGCMPNKEGQFYPGADCVLDFHILPPPLPEYYKGTNDMLSRLASPSFSEDFGAYAKSCEPTIFSKPFAEDSYRFLDTVSRRARVLVGWVVEK